MKKLKIILLVLVGLVLALFLAKDWILKTAATVAASRVLGAKVEMDRLSLGLASQTLRIEGLKIYSPHDFPRDILLNAPLIRADFDLDAIKSGKSFHLSDAEIHVAEVGLVRNSQGRLNVDSLAIFAQKPEQKKKQQAKEMPIQIDLLRLKVEKMVQKNYAGGHPTVDVYNLNLDRRYKNVTSVPQLVAITLTEPMKQAGIKGAAVYGAAALTGVGLVPVVAGMVLTGKDSASRVFDASFDETYGQAIIVLNKLGKVTRENRQGGDIRAQVQGATVKVEIRRWSDRETEVVVSARKYLLPKPEVASGIVHELAKKIR